MFDECNLMFDIWFYVMMELDNTKLWNFFWTNQGPIYMSTNENILNKPLGQGIMINITQKYIVIPLAERPKSCLRQRPINKKIHVLVWKWNFLWKGWKNWNFPTEKGKNESEFYLPNFSNSIK